MSIPVHIVMTLVLRTFQNNAASCLCDLVPWALGNTIIHRACEESEQKLETEPRKCPFASGLRRKLQPGPGKFKAGGSHLFPNSPVPRRQKATQQRSTKPMARRSRMEVFPALSVGKQGTGTGNCKDPVSDVTVLPDFLSFRER